MGDLLTRRVLAALLVYVASLSCAPIAHAQTAPVPPSSVTVDGYTLKYAVEYWIRATRIDDFDFDGTDDDGLNFGWHRVKPFFSVQKRWFELTLQGQDARSHHVPPVNPNGTSTYAGRTSQLDFVKAFVKLTPGRGVALKVGREQADGLDVGVSRKLASSSNYGTVLRSFDLVSLTWQRPTSSLTGFIADPVDNRPYGLNTRHHGELFWGLQAAKSTRRNAHRLYLVGRTIDANGPASETGVRAGSATYALGFQETGPLLVPGVTWEAEGIVEWGHRSTDALRAAAIFATATHAFTPNHSVYVGYYQSSGDGRRGDGTTHLFDTLYSSGFNNYGYLGLSQGRNMADVRVGGTSKIAGPASLLWTYHDQALSVRRDTWYAIFTPNVSRPEASSSRLGREIDATVLLRFPFAKRATIALGYLAFFPGRYLTATGPHTTAQQFAIDIWGQF